MEAEVDLEPLWLRSNQACRWCFPRVEDRELSFYCPRSEKDFAANSWKILEPIPERSEKVAVNELHMIVVPAVAFDRQGRRLGMGKGFYDRVLAKSSALSIGVCYGEQLSEELLPFEAHDQPVDGLITENFTLWPVRNEAQVS